MSSAKTTQNSCECILALDLPGRDEALQFLDELGDSLDWVKIGLQLFCKLGPDFIHEVADRNYRIFLDLKLYDIPNTVASAVSSLGSLPVDLLTLHTSGGSEMMQAAAEARDAQREPLKLLGVTVLTSFDQAGIEEIGWHSPIADQVQDLARLGVKAGLDGLVCSPLELAALRRELGFNPLLVTPGIRPAGSARDEQKRVQTPESAAAAGASFIVVGRPILRSATPAQSARDIRKALSN